MADQPNTQPLLPLLSTTRNLNIIIADLLDLHPFAGNTVDWLINVVRLIFEPLGMSSLYTFTTELLEYWLDREMEQTLWRQVVQGEQLGAIIYEFCPHNDTFIMLTKVSLHHVRSMTTNTSAPPAPPFHNALLQCHQTCIITQQPFQEALVASHLIPRCLSDAGVQSAFQCFTGSPAIIDKYDPLIAMLDSFMDV